MDAYARLFMHTCMCMCLSTLLGSVKVSFHLCINIDMYLFIYYVYACLRVLLIVMSPVLLRLFTSSDLRILQEFWYV